MSRHDFGALGISANQLPKETCKGSLLIVGGGRCVWDDLSEVDRSIERDVMCVNDVIMHYPNKIQHVFSNDDKWLHRWLSARRPRYKMNEDPPRVHTVQEGVNMEKWPFPGHGTSGLNACYVGLALGYENILLCGFPLDNSGHYFDPPWISTNFQREVPQRSDGIRYWQSAKENIFNGRVKSMSGRTAELLGKPDNNPGVSAFG